MYKTPPSIKTRRFIKKNKMVRVLVKARLERVLKKKMEEEMRILKARQKDLRNFVLAKRDNKIIDNDEDDDDDEKEIEELSRTFYYGNNNYWVYRLSLFRGLKKSWIGFRIGKRLGEEEGDLIEQRLQKDYAVGIQDIAIGRLDLSTDQLDFSRLGIFWDPKKKRSFVVKKDINKYIEEEED